jgi:hypothetical protein
MTLFIFDTFWSALDVLRKTLLEDEVRWEKAFACSRDALAKLAQETMAEDRAGKTKELDLDAL